MLTRTRALLLPAGLIVLALTVFNLRISRDLSDLEAARAAGRRAISAQPLYAESGTPSTFTALPALAVAMAPWAILGRDAARIGWFALSCAFLIILLRWSVIALPERRWSDRTLIMVALVLLARFYVHELAVGQVHLLLAVVLMAALGAVQLDAPRVAAVCIGVATFIEPATLLLLPWLAMSYGHGAGVTTVVTIAGGLILPAALYGWTGNLAQLAAWWQADAGLGDSVSVASMWATWLGPGALAAALATTTVLVLLAVAVAVWLQRRRVETPEYLEFALLLVLIPLVSPHSPADMLLLATPAVMLLVDRWRELSPPWRWSSALALMLVALAAMDLARTAPVITVCAIVITSALAQLRQRALG